MPRRPGIFALSRVRPNRRLHRPAPLPDHFPVLFLGKFFRAAHDHLRLPPHRPLFREPTGRSRNGSECFEQPDGDRGVRARVLTDLIERSVPGARRTSRRE